MQLSYRYCLIHYFPECNPHIFFVFSLKRMPSRKTKEAAAAYMEMLSKTLRSPDHESDSYDEAEDPANLGIAFRLNIFLIILISSSSQFWFSARNYGPPVGIELDPLTLLAHVLVTRPPMRTLTHLVAENCCD